MRSEALAGLTGHLQVDVDLSTEGDARKVSRLQAQLSLRADGRFQLKNIGRRRVLVNNRKVCPVSGDFKNLLMVRLSHRPGYSSLQTHVSTSRTLMRFPQGLQLNRPLQGADSLPLREWQCSIA